MRGGTGYAGFNEQRVDAWSIAYWKQNGITNLSRSFEIKVSRSDLLAELRNADKRWYAYSISHEFYFVTPPGLVKKSELGGHDGLIEVGEAGVKIVRKAFVRPRAFPRWSFVAGLARRAIGMPQIAG